ncbi:MAG: L,D-transpeptidase family protein [Planctomycetes bacterium]|nr:L,D-transpeptidase family protein [Planctomycetota bacterium]
MARRRRYGPARQGRNPLPIAVGLASISLLAWWIFSGADPSAERAELAVVTLQASSTADRPTEQPNPGTDQGITEKAAASDPELKPPVESAKPAPDETAALVKAGEQAVARKDLPAARDHFSEAFSRTADEAQRARLRAELTRIGVDTVFSPRIHVGDPLVERYTIKPGDSLGKIAKAYKVSPELLASINNLVDINRIRAGQVLKVIKGPFHAVVRKREYALDVYLGKTFVTAFPVGLGADDSTPEGVWRVGTKLVNPTYYPPRGGQVVSPDDPENPLGERWIGLVGVAGAAAGQERYGIHGTIEPQSIGKSMSLGCIRLYNKDVEKLYMYLVENHSKVTVLR